MDSTNVKCRPICVMCMHLFHYNLNLKSNAKSTSLAHGRFKQKQRKLSTETKHQATIASALAGILFPIPYSLLLSYPAPPHNPPNTCAPASFIPPPPSQSKCELAYCFCQWELIADQFY